MALLRGLLYEFGVRGEVACNLLGLFDALLRHPELDRFTAFVMRFIEESPLLDLVGYVATAILADRRETLIEPLRDCANLPDARGKAVREALDLRPA